MKLLLILTISLLFFSCQQKEKKTPFIEKSKPMLVEKNMVKNKQIGDTIFMNSKNEQDQFIAEGSIDSIHSRVYIKFRNEYPSELNGTIVTTTGKGNIRFNQIIFPDQSSDGPFGTNLKTDIEQKGDYVLVIGHSQMADNPYWGVFKVQIENKKK